MEISLYKDLYQGYISKEKNISKEESSKILEKCIKHTSKKLNIPLKSVKNNLYNLTSISRFSMNISPDYNNELIKYRKMATKQEEYSYTDYYYDGQYIVDTNLPGYQKITQIIMLELILLLIVKYKYIDSNKLTDYSYIMKLHNMSLPSTDWIQKQKDYLANLSYTDYLVIKMYTGMFCYEHVIINNYMRTGKIKTSYFNRIMECNPTLIDIFYKSKLATSKGEITFVEEEMKEFAEFVVERLNKIILESPKVDREFIVYRGKKRGLFRPDLKKENYMLKGFVSTSMNILSAQRFAGQYQHPRLHPYLEDDDVKDVTFFDYIEKIIIPPGSRGFLWTDLGESEIILPMDSRFKVLEVCEPGKILNTRRLAYRADKIYKEELDSESIFSYLKNLISSSYEKEDSFSVPFYKGNMCLVEYIP